MPPFNILIVTNSEPDQANQTLAIAHEFLAHSHNIRVHIASFAELAPSIKQLNHDRTTHHEATFHSLPGPSKREASDKNGFSQQNAFHAHSSFMGILRTYTQLLPQSRIPWTGPEYVTLYNHIGIIVADIFPLVIVIDATLAPGVDVCRTLKWRHVLVGSGLAHEYLPPSPGRVSVLGPRFLSLKNLTLGLLLHLGTTHSPHLQQIQTARRARGLTGLIPDPQASFPQPRDERPLLLLLLPTHRTYDPIPTPISAGVIHCGPITLPLRPIGKTHPDLALWLRQRPTVLITLGPDTRYPAREQIAFATAITAVLAAKPLVQVLWLMKPEPTSFEVGCYSDGLMDAKVLRLKAKVSPRNRLRIYARLPAETLAMLASGNVGCVVHRGEARVFGEGVRAGIPQIVLPMYLADYEYAQRVEDLGIGVGVGVRRKGAGGRVTGEQVEKAMLQVLDEEAGENMRERAEALAVRLLRKDGRAVAHERVLEMIGLRRGGLI